LAEANLGKKVEEAMIGVLRKSGDEAFSGRNEKVISSRDHQTKEGEVKVDSTDHL